MMISREGGDVDASYDEDLALQCVVCGVWSVE